MTQKTSTKEKWPLWSRVLLWGAVASLAVVIFIFSNQSGVQSNDTSEPVVQFALRVVAPDYYELPESDQTSLYTVMQYLVRKTAHFLEYAALGFFLRLLVASYGRKKYCFFLSFLPGALYAATDELHQLLGGTRTGMWQDVMLDSVGVLFGIAAAYALIVLGRRYVLNGKKRQKN